MDLWKYHENHYRLKRIKKNWAENRKMLAVQRFLFSLPNFLFPGADEQGRRGAYGYDSCWKSCRDAFGVRGMNSIRCWRIYLWRELMHLIGGFLLSIPLVLPLYFIFNFYLIMWFVPLLIAALALLKEILWDYKYEQAEIQQIYGPQSYEMKNLIDVIFWFLGASILPMVLTLAGKVIY